MRWRPADNSAFAMLSRAPWWVSVLIAGAAFMLARHFVPDVYAIFVPLPFYVTGGYAAWRQLRVPSGARIARTLEALRVLSADEFTRALEEAYRREGYTVARIGGGKADLELTRGARTTLVACRRWKAQRTGVEPLRELDAERHAREAHECAYVAVGEITDTARAFAAEKSIRLVGGAELARLAPRAVR
jgi:restriction system protein